jgi:diguanylate cyclase (GGDEF)-like protein/PAS domain S-box-containing protein
MCLVDVNGHLLRVNPQYCQILGYSREELEGVHINSITHPDSFKASQDFMRQALAGEVQRGEFVKRFIQKQGHVVFCRISSSLVRDHLGQPLYFISHVQDITESLRVEAELKRLANTDPLTGVANRRPFLEQMEIELARVQRFNTPASCLMLDFDHFKQINDRWGHSSGDAVLQYFSQLCQQRLRVTDLLGRLGGEEFAILMPGTDLAGATELAEQLRSWVESHPLVLREMHIPFCISLGVTELSRNDHSADEVLARTDTALYRAKDCGRNRVEAC